MFDAYTIKKVLPRLVAAAILIQLSWTLFTLLVRITGEISWGVEGLLYAPFGGRQALELGTILEKAVGNGTLTAALAAGVGWVALGAPGLLALAITIVLALIVAIFVLTVRQVLIIMLLVTAPIALVAWILPNTEKVWQLWWGTFSKLLLMYPLILLLLASGRITAKIVAESDVSELIKFIVIIIAFFGPFFLIAKTFQFAGGALASVGGALSGRAGKISGAMNKRALGKQGSKFSDWHTRADESRLFNPQGRLGRFNNAASSLVNPMAAARMRIGTKGGQAMLREIGMERLDGTEKMAGMLSKAGFNDRALNALTYWDGSQKKLEQLASQLDQAYTDSYDEETGAYDENYKIAAQQLRGSAPLLYNAYKSEEYGRGDMRAAAGLASAAQGFTSGEEISRIAKQLDTDYAGMGMGNAFKTQAELAGARGGALTKPGYTSFLDEDGQWKGADYSDTSGSAYKQISKIGVQDIGASKGLFGRKYINHNTGEIIDTRERAVGQGMIKTLQAGGDTAREVEGTLVTAYHSYNNPTVRKDVRKVLVGAYGEERADQLLKRGFSNQGDIEGLLGGDGDEGAGPFGGAPPSPN